MISGVILFLAYLATAVIGLQTSSINTFAALAWPPTGIAFFGLLYCGRKYWPAIFLGAFCANAYVGAPVLAALGIATGNTLEALLAAWWCSLDGGFHLALDRFSDVIRLIVRAATVSTLVSASLGVLSLWLAGKLGTDQVGLTWVHWWAGDTLSDLTFAPMLMILVASGKPSTWSWRPTRIAEAAMIALVTVVFSFAVLSGGFIGEFTALLGLRGIYMLIPLVLWAAVRFGQMGAVFAESTIAMIAVYNTAMGQGPFTPVDAANAGVVHLLIYVMVVALTALILGSVITERENERHAAETANLAKTEFLANMSHEIRTPLNAVMGFAELLVTPVGTPQEREKYMETIHRNGLLLLSIIDDVLDLSKIEVGKLQVEKSDVVIEDVIQDLIVLMKPRADGKEIEFKVTVDPSVPPVIVSDPQRLRQILLNLTGNAIKFTETGSVTVHLRLTFNEGPAKLEFAVKDTGVGVDPAHIQKIFNPFTQADASTTRKFGGTGLGLSLSRRLAQALGGDVSLRESTPGQGSVFVATIDPVSMRKSKAQASARTVALRRAHGEKELPNLQVLVVDDSVDNQVLMTEMLSRAGLNVQAAGSGREALGLVLERKDPYDLILMDLQMPDMDGYSVTRELRKSGYSRPIFALTAHATAGEREKCLENGFDEHIRKPVDGPRLIQRIATIVK